MTDNQSYSAQKFRPYFTATELLTVIDSLKQTGAPLNLIRYLETFSIKIERGLLTPAHTAQPTIEQKLGIVEPAAKYSPEQIAAMAKNYELFPAQRAQFTPRQLAEIATYRYVNDLMTKEEEQEYVSKL